MDYKEKYEQALERARELSKTVTGANYEYIFPELKESEEERIKKALIKILNEIVINTNYKELGIDYNIRDMIAWLEKQGEYSWKPTEEQLEALDYAYNNCPDTERGNYYESVLADLITDLHKLHEKQNNSTLCQSEVTKASKQKLKPKFKVGDWIIFNGLILHIDEVVNGYYRTTSRGDGIHNSYDWDIDNAARLWTIQEAKDGDVLTTDNFIFIFKSIDNSNGVHYYCHYEISKREDDRPRFGIALPQSLMGIVGSSFTHYKPATEEQRDLLFHKMKEAGYEWDADKKELRNIKPKTLDADKVIEWLKNNGWCTVGGPKVEMAQINKFKKDFGL